MSHDAMPADRDMTGMNPIASNSMRKLPCS